MATYLIKTENGNKVVGKPHGLGSTMIKWGDYEACLVVRCQGCGKPFAMNEKQTCQHCGHFGHSEYRLVVVGD